MSLVALRRILFIGSGVMGLVLVGVLVTAVFGLGRPLPELPDKPVFGPVTATPDAGPRVSPDVWREAGRLEGDQPVVEGATPVITSSEIEVLGTFLSPGVSCCIVRSGGSSYVHGAGAVVPGTNKEIVEVRYASVLFREGSQEFEVPVKASAAPAPALVRMSGGRTRQPAKPAVVAPVPGATSLITKAERDALPNQIFQDLRIGQRVVDGQAQEGWEIQQVRPGSMLERLGFQKNDLIKKVNGNEIDNPIQLLAELRTAMSYAVEVDRAGVSTTLQYQVQE